MNQDLTTLICLYHSKDHAQIAMEKVLAAGVPEGNVTIVGLDGSNIAASRSTLAELNVPEKDIQHLLDGISDGGAVVSVNALSDQVEVVEDIFHKYASKIDEVEIGDDMSGAALPIAAAATTGSVIPIVEEELAVGKRTVDAGGVRVLRRIVTIPVEESIKLREEHVTVQRQAVDRAVTDADLALSGDRVIEMTETAEEAVIGKTARVVEEITVGKEVSERTEHITDTVRRTEVEFEEIEPTELVDTARVPARTL